MTLFGSGEFPVSYSDWLVDHLASDSSVVEALAVPANFRTAYHGAFDPDGNLYYCDNHEYLGGLLYPGGGSSDYLGGGRLVKWDKSGTLDTAWQSTPAGDLVSGLWPRGSLGARGPMAPGTVSAISTGLLVGECQDVEAALTNVASIKLISYDDGTVIRTYPAFAAAAAIGNTVNMVWQAVDENLGIMYYVDAFSTATRIERYDLVNDGFLSTIFPAADRPATLGNITGLHRNSDGNLIVRCEGGSFGSTYKRGMFFIIDSTGAILSSVNLDLISAFLPDTASFQERIPPIGSWGIDAADPERVWLAALNKNLGAGTIDTAHFYHLDIPGATVLSFRDILSTTHYPIGFTTRTNVTASPALARYRPDGSRVWLRSEFA